jgi:hypothetical protein
MEKARGLMIYAIGAVVLNIAGNILTNPLEHHWAFGAKIISSNALPYLLFAALLAAWFGMSVYLRKYPTASPKKVLWGKRADQPTTPVINPLEVIVSAELGFHESCGVKWHGKLEQSLAIVGPRRHLVKVEGPFCPDTDHRHVLESVELLPQEPRMRGAVYVPPVLIQGRKLQDDDGGTMMEMAFCSRCRRSYTFSDQLGDCKTKLRNELEEKLGLTVIQPSRG